MISEPCPFLMDLWRRSAGLPPASIKPPMPDLAELRRTEWSGEFEQAMRARLLMGAFRYRRLRDPDRPPYDTIPSMIKRLKKYEKDGNLEHLVDVANLALVEFVTSRHPLKHFSPVDADLGQHVQEKVCK